ncbi:MAG: hypothetical protein NVS3B20_02320 [Polyangiales bacterium]
MRKAQFLRVLVSSVLLVPPLSVLSGAALTGGCADSFDTSRPSTPTATLGEDLYVTLCDRVAASAEPSDLEGRRSRAVCHPDASGTYADHYEDMPAKVAVMARRRPDLIAAFNAIFPDKDHLQEDLGDLMKAHAPHYDDDTLPQSTRTLADLFDTIAFDQNEGAPGESAEAAKIRGEKAKRGTAIREALARLSGRTGYRPLALAMGVSKPLLAYPHLNEVVESAIHLVGRGGAAEPEFRKLLEVTQAELASSTFSAKRAPIPGYADRFSGTLSQRAKLTSDVLKDLLIAPPPLLADLSAPAYPNTWTDAYAASAPPLPYLQRDRRGYAAFTIFPDGAADVDADKLPAVDRFGRFISKGGAPLPLPTPFATPSLGFNASKAGSKEVRDALGRALISPGGAPIYRYGDATRTLLHSLLRDLQALAENGALLDAAQASLPLFGPRASATPLSPDRTAGTDVKTYANPFAEGRTLEVSYRRFDGNASPVTDVVHAASAFLQYPKIGDYLELSRQLLRDHPNTVARVLGAILKLRDTANLPAYATVALDPKSSLWDDAIEVAIKIAAEPDLLHDVLDALADDDIVLLSKTISTYDLNRDELDYDPAADGCDASKTCPPLNNPWYNVSKGSSKIDPATPTDLTKPDDEGNRSLFQRFASLIHDGSGVRACNKAGARIAAKPIGLPLVGTFRECEVLDIPDLSAFYLG